MADSRAISCNDLGEPTNALGLAATADRLYVSLFDNDKIMVLDAASGQKVGEIAIPKPVGLHAVGANTAVGKARKQATKWLLAVSGKTVVKIDLASKRPTPTPLVTEGLVAPHEVTIDRAGQIYVSDWGASFQVKVFSPRGQFVRAIGKEGGRPWIGAWQDDGMLVPRGIAVTDEGQLWVAEDDSTPRADQRLGCSQRAIRA